MRLLFKYLRLTVLLLLLAGTVNLWHWSRTNDPRFYQFAQSPTGQVVARVMQWHAHTAIPPLNKPESEMSREELTMKRHLEKHAYRQPGEDGALPEIYYRDIRFKMEHPALRLYRCPPYSVMSDESPESVMDCLAQLETLHGRFSEAFGPLKNRDDRQDGIQVLLFSDYHHFANYQRKVAPGLGESAGFFSPHLDRFILYNQASHFELLQNVSAAPGPQRSFDQARKISFWNADIQQQITRSAQRETSQTLRHEGAHQLFHAYGIHSDIRAENTWLLEGLAAYCETDRLGARQPLYAEELRLYSREETLIDLKDLLANRSLKGFFEYESSQRTQLAYAQSWSLVHMLMQPAYRDNFFAYIAYIRDRRHTGDLLRRDRVAILAGFLNLEPEILQQQWQAYTALL